MTLGHQLFVVHHYRLDRVANDKNQYLGHFGLSNLLVSHYMFWIPGITQQPTFLEAKHIFFNYKHYIGMGKFVYKSHT